MTRAESVPRALLDRAFRSPDEVVYRFFDVDGRTSSALTVGDLVSRAAAVASRLAALPVTGEPVLLCTGPGPEQAVGLFACWMAGATAIPVYPPPSGDGVAALDALVAVARRSGARALLSQAALGDTVGAALGQALGSAAPPLVDLEGSEAAADPRPDLTRWDAAAPAILLYTSGSTGQPKGVVITHGAWAANLSALVERCVPDGAARVCTWLPHAHVAGLYTRLLPVVSGGEAIVLPPAAFTRRPTTWLETISRTRATLSAAPDFAYALSAQVLDDETVARLDLSAWKMAVSGGERVRASTVESFFSRLAPAGLARAAFHPYYGMTETLCNAIPQRIEAARLGLSQAGLGHGRVRPPENEQDAQVFLGNGASLGSDTEILAVHPEGRWPCPPGQIGELWTRGPAVTPGYHRDAAATEAALGWLADGQGPYFRTGDLGVVEAGQIFVTGRLKELLIVRGKNHYPQDLEATASRAAGLPDGAAAAFTVIQDDEEALGLALEIARGPTPVDEIVRATRRAIARAHGLAIARLFLLAPGSLPRTATSKISRAECRRLSASGAWDAFGAAVTRRRTDVAAPRPTLEGLTGSDLRRALLAALVSILAEGEAGALEGSQLDQAVGDLGLGSLEMARVATALRALTGIKVPYTFLFDDTTVRQLAERLADRMEGTAAGPGDLSGWRREVRAVVTALPDERMPSRTRGGATLLTGATGFFGSYLLASLLRLGRPDIRCLVRAPDRGVGLDRLVAALKAGPGWDDAWAARLVAVPGDLTQPRLGQTEAGWRALADAVGTVVHNGADVNFVAPYAALHRVNVAPAHTLLELALAGGEARTVHLVSTLAVFNATSRREQRRVYSFDRLIKPDHLYSGYAQSKWVAEACFRVAGVRGIPMGIHRPGVITGSHDAGHTHVDDFLCRFIRGCVALGTYPEADVELDLVAVDDVADGIAAAVCHAREVDGRFVETYHWSNPRPVTIEALMSVYRARGYPLSPIPLARWLDRIREGIPEDNPLFPLHPFLLEVPEGSDETILEFMDGLPHLIDTTEADRVRAVAGIPGRTVDAGALDRMAIWLETHGHLTRPTRAPEEIHDDRAS